VTLPVFMLDSDAGSDPVKTLLGQAPETLDLQCAPLMRLYAMRAKEGEGWYALLQSHHLAGDNESLQAMLAEVMDHLNGRSDRLPVPGAYRDHVARTVSACEPEKAERFFRDKLSAVDEPTLPFGLADVHGQGDDIDEATREVDPSLGERVRAQARELCVSPATLFHAAWSLVVARTSGRDDVVFGTVLLGRMEGSAGTQPALGMFVNTLPLRLNLDGACARELVAQTQRELVDLLSHEQVSLATAQRCSGVAETTPLFSALLNYRHSDLSGGVSEGVKILARRERTNYPITLSIDDARDGFSFTAKTDKAVRASRIIEYLHTATASLVSALEQGSEVPALSLEILPEAEREQILRSFNATDKPLPREKSLHQLFEEQAGRTPDALALSYQDQWLSFSKLDAKANQVANRLRGLGAGPDRCVGLCLGRSLELVIGILGILKAGSAYVPLDPALPAARLQEIVEEIEAVALLTQSHLRDRLVHTGAGVFALDEWLREPMSDESGTFSSNVSGVSPHHLAYVIYTSGSTGKAKGVMIEHVNVVSLWSALEHLYIHKPGILRIGMNASFTFDSSIKQLVQLLSGRSVCIVPQACREDASLMLAFLERQHIEVIDCTPSQLKAWISAGLMERGLRLRMVLVGGEEIDEGLWGRLAACTSIDFVNVYGPTECTVDATAAFLRGDAGKPHIGRAMDHRRIYIVNHRADLVPIGVAGEICIGDASVGRGYLNREALTRERFRPDPFSEDAGARMYLSGDIGRWRADGVIEYLGRNDHQVKIRGYRIEVGEIEADLARHARVKDAVVVAREDCAGDKRLVAYFTLRDGAPPTAEELRVYLATRLPDYMIPRVFVNLDQLPLNANGKVNRRALPAPDPSADESKAFEAPQGEAEDVLAGIWRSVLAVERVGRHDDFFELGGHSLSAMQAIVRIRAAMSIDMPVSTLFRYPTVRLLAGRVAELSELRAGEAVLAGRPAPRSHECTMEGIS
jgi:amino acid adenylation domain-containing protein